MGKARGTGASSARARKRSCKLRGLDARGVVMAEFLVALFPVLLAFLGFTQLAFIAIAKLMVRHAAVLATRAAVVVLEEADGIPGAPVNIYGGYPAGGLEVAARKDSGQNSTAQAQDNVAGVANTANNSDSSRSTVDGLLGSLDRTSSRIKQIRTAAYWPLLAISPNLLTEGVDLVGGIANGSLSAKPTVKSAIGKSDATRIVGAFLYNLGAVAVTFPQSSGSKELHDASFAQGEMITTRVSYLFRCQVPLVSPIICSSGWALMFGDAWVDPIALKKLVDTVGSPPKHAQDLPGWVDQWKNAKDFHEREQRRVDAFKGREAEFEQVEWPFMKDVLLAWPGARYFVLSAEAQLPLQSARYYPRVNDDVDVKHMQDLQKKQQGGQGIDVKGTLQPVANAVSQGAQAVASGMDAVSNVADNVGNAVTTINNVTTQLQGVTSGLSNTTSAIGGATSGLSGGVKNALGSGAKNNFSGGDLASGLTDATRGFDAKPQGNGKSDKKGTSSGKKSGKAPTPGAGGQMPKLPNAPGGFGVDDF